MLVRFEEVESCFGSWRYRWGVFALGGRDEEAERLTGSVLARLVIYEDATVAEKALIELNESELDGRKLYLRKVCFSKHATVA